MKRKLLIILLGAVALCACVFGFAGCDLLDSGSSNGGGEHVHTIIYISAKKATCKETGTKECWYCNTCGKYFSDEEGKTAVSVLDVTLEKTGHTEVTDPAIEATCTTAGKTAGKHCTVCGTVTLAQTDIPAQHKVVIDKGVDPTCTTAGKSEGSHCSECHEVLVTQHVLAPQHTEVIDPAVEATCTTEGKTAGKHCSVCGTVTLAQTILPVQHKEVTDPAVAATCTTEGKTAGKHCSECHEVLVEQRTVPAQHKVVIDQAIAATCTTEGKTEGKHCSECNTVILAQQTTQKAEHSGNGTLCKVCGDLLVAPTEGLTFAEVTRTFKVRRAAYSDNTSTVGGASTAGTITITGYEVTGGNEVRGDLVIPSSHNGMPVLGIGDQAFRDNHQLRTVTIPNGVKYIGVEAFAYCIYLIPYIADSVEEIGVSAFRGSTNGNFFYFKCPKNLTEISEKTFVSSTLRTIVICENVTKVSLTAFTGCNSLTDIYFEGTEEKWNQVKDSWCDVTPTISFYSETTPTASGNFWHYVDGVATKWN